MNWIAALPIFVVVFVLPVGYFLWLRALYKPPEPGRAVAPEYEPPAELGPVEAGMLLDNAFTPRDAAAMFIGLKLRGVIDFTVVGGKVGSVRMLPGAETVRLAPVERLALDAIFAGRGAATADEAKAALAKVRRQLVGEARRLLKAKGLIADDRTLLTAVFLASAIAALIFAAGFVPVIGLVGALAVAASLILIAELAFIAALLRPRLTPRGREALAELQGFRMYLSAAEGDRMRWAEESQDKVDRFTPYAIVFGVSPHWSAQLQGITNSLLEDWSFKT